MNRFSKFSTFSGRKIQFFKKNFEKLKYFSKISKCFENNFKHFKIYILRSLSTHPEKISMTAIISFRNLSKTNTTWYHQAGSNGKRIWILENFAPNLLYFLAEYKWITIYWLIPIRYGRLRNRMQRFQRLQIKTILRYLKKPVENWRFHNLLLNISGISPYSSSSFCGVKH